MEQFIQQEQVRGAIYYLLSKCYEQPKGQLQKMEVLDQLQNLLKVQHPEAAEEVEIMKNELSTSENQEELVQEYLALFVGPKTLLAAPYGSLYLENKGQIMGASTQEAIKYYEAAGLKKKTDMHQPDDHIRIELEFIYYLIGRVIDTCEKNDLTSAEKFASFQKEFLERHIGNWVRPFTSNMERQATSPYFKALARVTESFVRKDATEDSAVMMEELKSLQ